MRNWLKELRKTSGIAQSEVAEALKINQGYFSMIESGERQKKMSLELAQKISELFGVSIEYILEQESEG